MSVLPCRRGESINGPRVYVLVFHEGLLRVVPGLIEGAGDLKVVGCGDEISQVSECLRSRSPDVLVMDLASPAGDAVKWIGGT